MMKLIFNSNFKTLFFFCSSANVRNFINNEKPILHLFIDCITRPHEFNVKNKSMRRMKKKEKKCVKHANVSLKYCEKSVKKSVNLGHFPSSNRFFVIVKVVINAI